MTPRTPDQGGSPLASCGSLGGLPQLIRYTSSYPAGDALLEALHMGVLRQRTMAGGFLWALVEGVQLMRIASVGWHRDVVDRYAIIPLTVDVPATIAVQQGTVQVNDIAGFGRTYLQALDDGFLTPHFDAMAATSAINVPLRHAGVTVGVLGFVTTEPWCDDEGSGTLLEGLGALLGMWITHPRSGALDVSPSLGQREWSLAFTPRQRRALRLAGAGQSNSDIARELLVSTSSVKQDLQQAMRALRSHDRTTAFERAVRLGLLD